MILTDKHRDVDEGTSGGSTPVSEGSLLFSTHLQGEPPDPLLSLIAMFKADPRPGKLDLGVGVYRDDLGGTPVLSCVKEAERRLVEGQDTKSYLGPEGDQAFLRLAEVVVFGAGGDRSLLSLQTPGGTGALRLAAELTRAARPGGAVWIGSPSWPIHAPIFRACGLEVRTYSQFDAATQTLLFDQTMAALAQADAGDVVLLHGCCHNPTGADFAPAQWRDLAHLVARRGLVPLIDLAYQGLGLGLEEDAAGARLVFDAADQAMLAWSCDKNFGLYRERTGAFFVKAGAHSANVRSVLLALARYAWSMPPDHGAAVVRLILESSDLTSRWHQELEDMRARLVDLRRVGERSHALLAHLPTQNGMFALLPLSPAEIAALRTDHAVYMAGSGRINLAGLSHRTLPTFARALDAVHKPQP